MSKVPDALAVREEEPEAQAITNREVPISAILANAVSRGSSVDVLERIVALHERVQASRAKAEYAAAMSAFKAECPPVQRRTENNQFKVTRNGVSMPRKYASLEDIGETVRGPLGDNGLSFKWSDATVDGGILKVSCVVSHIGGHSEASSAQVPIDSKAGCSDQQKMGTAMTYAQRYSLIAALGLTTCDEDDDGAGPDAPKITEHQAANIDAMIDSVGANRARFLAFMGVERVADIPAARHAEAIAALEAKRKAAP